MKVAELEGISLDYWVAKAEGRFRDQLAAGFGLERDCEIDIAMFERMEGRRPDPFKPSTNWAQGGPIIEREMICVAPACKVPGGAVHWAALRFDNEQLTLEGPTPLIAAMRCLVASKFGEEVPDDMTVVRWKCTAKFDGGETRVTYGTSTISDPEVKKATDAALERSMRRVDEDGRIVAPGRAIDGLPAASPGRGAFGKDGT